MAGFRIFDEPKEPAKSASPQVGGTFGAYTLTKLLGEGAMSWVFLGENGGTGEQAAIKFLKVDEYEGTPNEVAHFRKRFGREVRLLSRVRHPHLVEILDADLDGAWPYYVMERLEGKTLQARLKIQPALSYAAICRIGREVALALAAAWGSFRVVHRDLKPSNVMLVGKAETVKVIDLGIAKAIGGDTHGSQITTVSGMAIGTPYYMSPEQHLGEKEIDFRADMYSLGIILCELLSFRYPFAGSTHLELLSAKQSGVEGQWERLASGAPRELVGAVNCLLRPRREARYESYAALAAVLAEAEAVASTRRRQHPGDIVVTGQGTQVMGGGQAKTALETRTDAVEPADA